MEHAHEVGRATFLMRESMRALRILLTGSRLKVLPEISGLGLYASMERLVTGELRNDLRRA